MIRAVKGFGLTLAALAVLAVPASAQDISGAWIFTLDSPEMGEMAVEFVFEQDGSEVTGTADMPMPEIEYAEIVEGSVEDGILFFILAIGAQGQGIDVEMEAEIDGDEMVGEAYVAEMGMATPFTAKRKEG